MQSDDGLACGGFTATRFTYNAQALAAMPDVNELILSGGDPLMLADRRLGELLDLVDALPQLRRLRVHTRLPVVLPSRLTLGLARLFAGRRLAVAWVIHANHPRELSPELAEGLRPLRSEGVQFLNQAVLLKSVNDDADTLAMLSTRLFDIGVLPYYLHLLDRVQGTAHFEVPRAQAQALYAELLARLPGYLVPKLVCERAGAPSKVPVPPLGSC